MLNKNKFVNLICALLIGVVLMLVILSVLVVSGVISLNKMSLTVSTKGSEAMYSGIPLTNHSMQIESGVLKEGHNMSYKVRGSQTNVGESENYIDLVITDELDADVTSDYDIEYKLGKLKITPRTILVAYDDNLQKYVVAEEFDGLVAGHFIVCTEGSVSSPTTDSNHEQETGNAEATTQKYVNVTVYDSYGQDVTQNYNIKAAVGIQLGNEQEQPSEFPSDSESEETTAPIDIDSDLDLGPELYDVEFYQITADNTGKVYLRSQSYGNYFPGQKEYWGEANEFDSKAFDESGASPYYLPVSAFTENGDAIQNIDIKPSLQGVPYVLPYYSTVYINNEVFVQTSDVYTKGTVNVNTPYTVQYYNYDASAVLSDPALLMYEQYYRTFVYENYLYVDYETLNYMLSVIDSQGFNAEDEDIINKVAQYISTSATYDLNYDTKLDESSNMVIDFLEIYKSGVCRHYATAATLMYRALGIPARYCVGFVTETLADSTVIVKGKNAHAWVEVYIDGFGWVCVEVTGSDPGLNNGENSGVDEGMEDEISIGENPNADMLLYSVLGNSNTKAYLREKSVLDYTGKGWTQAPEYNEFIRDSYPASMLSSFALAQAGVFRSDLAYITSLSGGSGMPYYIDNDFPLNDFSQQLSDVSYKNENSNYAVAFYDVQYKKFKGLYLPEDLVDYELRYRDFVYQNYLNVDDGELKQLLLNIIEENGLRNNGDIYNLIDEVSSYVTSCAVYDMEGAEAIKDSEDIVLSFLYQGSGVCRHFASTATLMFRLLGVPARYTVGAIADCQEMTSVDVMGDSAHAWVEVYIDGIGWVCVEVTPGYYVENPPIIFDISEETTVEGGPYEDGYYEEEVTFIYGKDENGEAITYYYPSERVEVYNFAELSAQGYTYELTIADENGTYEFADPGTYKVQIKDVRFYLDGADVTDRVKAKYDIVFMGEASMYVQRPVFIQGDYFEKFYDGKEITNEDIESRVVFLYPENEVQDHKITYTLKCDGILATGTDENEAKHDIIYNNDFKVTDSFGIDGNDVTKEYHLLKNDLKKVTIKHVVMNIKSEEKWIINGEDYDIYKDKIATDPHSAHTFTVTVTYEENSESFTLTEDGERPGYYMFDESLGLSDHRIKIEFDDSVLNPHFGFDHIYFTAHVCKLDNGEEEDVTVNFAITIEAGSIIIGAFS